MTITINKTEYEVAPDLFPGYDLERLVEAWHENNWGTGLSEFVRFWQNRISSVDGNFTEMKHQ